MSQAWKSELAIVKEASRQACEILKDYFGHLHQVREKGKEGLVSEADQNSEKVIRKVLNEAFPQDAILGEEEGYGSGPRSGPSKREWIIDPLDGTTNYVHRFPFFATSLGLRADGEIKVGWVEAPLLGWTYHAVRGQGAFLNGQPIQCSNADNLKDSLLATGFSYSRAPGLIDHQAEVFKHMLTHARGVRRAGSAALDLCMVASGSFEGYWERTLKPWDTAAGSLIAQEAGAIVTDFDGKPYSPERDDVLAAAPGVHGQILNLLSQHKLSV